MGKSNNVLHALTGRSWGQQGDYFFISAFLDLLADSLDGLWLLRPLALLFVDLFFPSDKIIALILVGRVWPFKN